MTATDKRGAAETLLERLAIPEIGALVVAADDQKLRDLYAQMMAQAMRVRDGGQP